MDTAIISALNITNPRPTLIWAVLHSLAKLKDRPSYLTGMAYGWCAAILRNCQSFVDWRDLLVISLEIGFRHFDERKLITYVSLTPTEHHWELFDAVLGSNDVEAIADLFQAFTAEHNYDGPEYASLNICAPYIVDLHNRVRVPFSPRLRQLVARSISQIGFERLEEVGAGKFVELLNHFYTNGDELDPEITSDLLLLGAFQSPEGVRHLVLQCWKSLVEVGILFPWRLSGGYNSYVTTSLLDEQEWDKLECWIGVVWMTWPPETDDVNEDLRCAMVSLFRKRPGTIRKLTEWLERWSKECNKPAPVSFHQTCEQAREEAQLGVL